MPKGQNEIGSNSIEIIFMLKKKRFEETFIAGDGMEEDLNGNQVTPLLFLFEWFEKFIGTGIHSLVLYS